MHHKWTHSQLITVYKTTLKMWVQNLQFVWRHIIQNILLD